MQEDEEELAHYIKKVDENIQQEVLSQEEKEQLREKQTKAQKKEAKEAKPLKSSVEKQKPRRSLKDIWDSFIDESDNPYSVFSQKADESSGSSDQSDKEVKEENIILINEEVERSHNPSEDTFQTASDISNLTRRVNEVLEQEAEENAKKSEKSAKDKPAVREKSMSGGIKNFFKSFSKDSKKVEEKTTQNSDSIKTNQKESTVSADTVQPKAVDQASVSTNEIKERQSDKKTDSITDKAAGSTKNRKFFKGRDIEKSPSAKESKTTHAKSKTKNKNYLQQLGEAHKRYQQIIYKILDYGQNGLIAIFAVGLLALIIPFFLIDTKITIPVILFILIKILISFFTIYYAYIIATRNTGLYLDEKRIFVYAGFNWSIINLVLFIFFLFYPHDVAIGYNFLGALTPKLIPTIISYLLVSFLTLTCLYDDLDKDNYINFMGWFLTLYIGIELASKLFWVLIDFIFNSVL